MPSCSWPTLSGSPSGDSVVMTSGKVASRAAAGIVDRHVFVHDVEWSTALSPLPTVDRADVEGFLGVDHVLLGDRAFGEDRAAGRLDDRVDDRASRPCFSAAMIASPSVSASEMPPSAALLLHVGGPHRIAAARR